MEWMLLPYKRYFDFSGRSRRKEFWMFYLFFMVVYVGLAMIGAMFAPTIDPATGELVGGGAMASIFGILALVFVLGSIIPMLACQVRRAHDSDKSGWFILVPIYSLILMFLEGTRGPNRFGPDPKDPGEADTFA